MAYSDANLTHNPSTGAVAPAAWGDVIRDNQEFFIDPPACSVYNNGVQSVATSTAAATFADLTADSENFDNDVMHSTVSLTSRITAQTAGRYQFFATVSFASAELGGRAVRFLRNGGAGGSSDEFPGMRVEANTETGQGTVLTIIRAMTLAAGDYVSCQVGHDRGSSLNVNLVEYGATYITR